MSDGQPLVSVIVVCWNSADVLGECIDRLLQQDYPNYEIVVVDDGSVDETLAVAEDALASARVTVVRSPLNRGCPHARNLGLRHARGDIVAFIDADGFATTTWLRNIVREFEKDGSVGGVASTVFFAKNPLIINGAGGTVNRQGWAADIEMNRSYERAEIPRETLYPMGCGMALRRRAVEEVGMFDDRMLNYYDDVDYGIRLWRAGYRVVVAADAWIDHGFGQSGGDSTHKQLLCEQHRMRVVLKHEPARTLPRWIMNEVWDLARAFSPRRELKLAAIGWNMRHLPSTLLARGKLREAPRPPAHLYATGSGDDFPRGIAPLNFPEPDSPKDTVDMSSEGADEQLLYGWFPRERDGRGFRWAGTEAALLVRLQNHARVFRIEYAHVPVDTGGVELRVRRIDGAASAKALWSTRLEWRHLERVIERHPVSFPPGEYEVILHAPVAWTDPPVENRRLSLALSRISFEPTLVAVPDGLDMAVDGSREQLVNGWFEREEENGRHYRWAGGRAGALVHLSGPASSARLTCRTAPGGPGTLTVAVTPVGHERACCTASLAGDGAWRDETLDGLPLAAGDYVVTFEAGRTWSNPGQRDPALPPDDRTLGFALSRMTFER